jgi:transposase
MLAISEETKIHVYTAPIDMRKSIDGLVVLVADLYKQNPLNGEIFIFTNKQYKKIKLFFWDKNGFVLCYKRLEQGRFCYSKYLPGDEIVISQSQLRGLLMGLDFYLMGQYANKIEKEFF